MLVLGLGLGLQQLARLGLFRRMSWLGLCFRYGLVVIFKSQNTATVSVGYYTFVEIATVSVDYYKVVGIATMMRRDRVKNHIMDGV